MCFIVPKCTEVSYTRFLLLQINLTAMLTPSTLRFLSVLLVGALAAAGCDADSTRVGEETRSEVASETCAGATAEESADEYHPRILRGRVLAPSGELASRWQMPGWLVGAAHAAPLEAEQTVPQARVELYRVGPSGERSGEVLREATTDVTGEWCMKLPDGIELGADLMLAAGVGDARLRRSVVSQFSTDLYSASEALTRLLQARRVDFSAIPDETYLNMEAIADTRVDLLEPVDIEEGEGVEEVVAKIRKVLAGDERLQEKLARLDKLAD